MNENENDDRRVRDKRISIKVTAEVYSYIENIAHERGLSMSALCGNVIGEFKVKQQREERAFRETVEYSRDKTLNNPELIEKTIMRAVEMFQKDIPRD